jgi:hypothetical protein
LSAPRFLQPLFLVTAKVGELALHALDALLDFHVALKATLFFGFENAHVCSVGATYMSPLHYYRKAAQNVSPHNP